MKDDVKYRLIVLIILGVLLSSMSLVSKAYAQTVSNDSVYWYQDNEKQVWFYQDDVFAFRAVEGQTLNLPLNHPAVEKVILREESSDKINLLFFKSYSDEQLRETVRDQLRTETAFYAEFPVITQKPSAPHAHQYWYFTNTELIGLFNSFPAPSTTLDHLESSYALTAEHVPGSNLPQNGNYNYIFSAPDGSSNFRSAIDLAAAIYEAEPGMFKYLKPNIINANSSTGTLVEAGAVSKPEFVTEMVVLPNDALFLHLNPHNGFQTGFTEIFDMQGRRVHRSAIEAANQRHQKIELQQFGRGIYILRVTAQDGSELYRKQFIN